VWGFTGFEQQAAVGSDNFGDASAAVSPFSASGAGLEIVAGAATAAARPFAASAAGLEIVDGSAVISCCSFAAASDGLESIGGSAGVALQSFAADSSAEESFAGSAEVSMSPFAALGADTTPPEDRTFIVPPDVRTVIAMRAVAIFYKAPTAVADYGVDWSRELRDGDAVLTSSWSVTPDDPDFDDLVASIPVLTTTITGITLSGGTVDKKYKVVNTVVTKDGRTLPQTLTVIGAPR
jgi:hypothetical protein